MKRTIYQLQWFLVTSLQRQAACLRFMTVRVRWAVAILLAYGIVSWGNICPTPVTAAESIPAIMASTLYSDVTTLNDARIWTDQSGKFSVKATLVAYDGTTVVLRKESGTLVTLTKLKLSEKDQTFLDSQSQESTTTSSADPNPFDTAAHTGTTSTQTAPSAQTSPANADKTNSTDQAADVNNAGNAGKAGNAGVDETLWTLIDGSQIHGTAAGFGSIDMMFTRNRGSVYVDGRLLRDYPKDYQQVIRLAVENAESIRVRDNTVLDRWVAKQRDGRSIHLEGVYIVCNGQQYLLPIRLIRSQDTKRIQAGFDAWYQTEELPRLKAEREKNAAKEEEQKAKDEEREYQENKERRERALDEIRHRETLQVLSESTGPMYRWRVFMVGSVGAMTHTFWTVVPARSTSGARMEAEQRHPGYRATAVDLVGSVYPYPYNPIPGPMPGPIPRPDPMPNPAPEPDIGIGSGNTAD